MLVLMDARGIVVVWQFQECIEHIPSWVRKDIHRFPRVHTLEAGGARKTFELLSPFNEQAWRADAKAFAKLMLHLKDFDSEHSTVIMVQVEYETGPLDDFWYRLTLANYLYEESRLENAIAHLQKIYQAEIHAPFRQRSPKFETSITGSTTLKEAFGSDNGGGGCSWQTSSLNMWVKSWRLGRLSTLSPVYTNVMVKLRRTQYFGSAGIVARWSRWAVELESISRAV